MKKKNKTAENTCLRISDWVQIPIEQLQLYLTQWQNYVVQNKVQLDKDVLNLDEMMLIIQESKQKYGFRNMICQNDDKTISIYEIHDKSDIEYIPIRHAWEHLWNNYNMYYRLYSFFVVRRRTDADSYIVHRKDEANSYTITLVAMRHHTKMCGFFDTDGEPVSIDCEALNLIYEAIDNGLCKTWD